MADNNTVARPYAEAVFEIARDSNALDELSESLGAGSALLADGQVDTFLANPALADDERLGFLHGLFEAVVGKGSVFAGGSQHGTNFLKLLLENGRVGVLPEIASQFEALKAEVENSVDVVVTSATPLTPERQTDIANALKARLGRDIRLATEIDESLIGGAVIRAGDIVIDGSVSTRLESLTHSLVN